MNHPQPIHIYVPAGADDPRVDPPAPEGVIVHRGPALHPDDLAVVDGIPCTSLARTLIDIAECMDESELREVFAAASDRGMLDLDDLAAARGRVEWRPSLELFDAVSADFGL